MKKAKQSKRSSRSKNSQGAKNSMPFPWTLSSRAIVLVVICVLAGAALITARQPSHETDVASPSAPPEANTPTEPTPFRRETKKAVASKTPASAAAASTHIAHGSVGNPPAVESVKAPAVEFSTKAAAVESPARTDVQPGAPVTITGCLEVDRETFWLKDTSGVDAPKARSWRSGFLKKRSSRIELMDPTNTLKLPDYVGQRIAATGTLMNREMRTRSLHRVAASCN